MEFIEVIVLGTLIREFLSFGPGLKTKFSGQKHLNSRKYKQIVLKTRIIFLIDKLSPFLMTVNI